MKIIEINNWKRKEHFEFFSKMVNPYFGIIAEVDCTNAYKTSKEKGYSFFAYYLFKSMIAANSIEELRLRIVENKVVLFDHINIGTTIAREDGTFGFTYVNYSSDFEKFNAELQIEIESVHNSTGLRLKDDETKKDLIRCSVIPWTSFTGLLHPTNMDRFESVPKIVFGKFSIRDGRKFMPVSIEANHGLLDGYHLGKYFREFQIQLDKA